MASIGTIVTRVYTSRAELPVQGAIVTFTRKSNGEDVVLARQVTDESGRTAPLSFYTPDLAESMAPGGKTSYVTCDLHVQHPGYLPFQAEDVQIFPGVRTVHKVELIPLPEHTRAPKQNDIVFTPPQDL